MNIKRSVVGGTLLFSCWLAACSQSATPASHETVGEQTQKLSLTLTPVNIGFNNPIAVDYHQPTNKVVLSVGYPVGEPSNFELVAADGTRTPFSSINGLTDEVYIGAVRDTLGGFTPGELFTGTGVPGVVARISPDGSTIANPWVTLPGEPGLLRGALHVDRTGVFGGDLLVATTVGNVWRIDSAGTPQLLGSTGVLLEGMTSLPNDPAYGPWAGKIVAGSEASGLVYAVGADGSVASFAFPGMTTPENINLIPANENFYGVDFSDATLFTANASQFTGLVGDVLIGEEVPGNLWDVRWNGSSFDTTLLATVSQWEGAAFAPVQLPSTNHPPTVTCPDPSSGACTSPAGATQTLSVTVADSDNDTLTVTWSVDGSVITVDTLPPASTSATFTNTYAVGAHDVSVHVDDGKGGTADCSTSVTTLDVAPSVSTSVGTASLWPPNHNLINVGFTATIGDVCDADPAAAVRVYANEDDETPTGDGNFAPDAKDLAAGTLRLRAERKGDGVGRVYLLVASASDAFGGASFGCSAVVVPHDQSKASIAGVQALAAAAVQFCEANGGAAPSGYFVLGDGPAVGPKQ